MIIGYIGKPSDGMKHFPSLLEITTIMKCDFKSAQSMPKVTRNFSDFAKKLSTKHPDIFRVSPPVKIIKQADTNKTIVVRLHNKLMHVNQPYLGNN